MYVLREELVVDLKLEPVLKSRAYNFLAFVQWFS